MSAPPPGPTWKLGISDVRVQLTVGLRAVNHVVLAVRAVGQNGRSRGWLGVAAVSVAADLARARRLQDRRYVPGWGRWLCEWADCAVWAHATENRMDVLPLMAASAMTPTIEAAVDAFAGTTAVPVYNPDRAWPPADRRDTARRAARLAATAVTPVLITGVVRRRRGLPAASEHLLWGLASAALTAFGARQRDRLHTAERARWAERTATQVREELDAARASLAMGRSPGHDFKKTLLALGIYGSARALHEARAQTDHPAHLLADLDGQTLFAVTRSSRLEPPDAATRWLSTRQAGEVRAFLTAAEDAAVDGDDQRIRVRPGPPDETVIEYLGQRLTLRNEPPPLGARLHPTSFLLATAAFHALDTAILGELPVAAAIPPAAIFAAAAWRFRGRPPGDDDVAVVLRAATVPTVLGLLVSASSRAPAVAPLGYASYPASAFARAYFYVLGAHWSRLRPAERALLPGTVAAWAAASRYRRRRDPFEMLVALVELLPSLVCSWRGNDLVDAEARYLEQELQREFSAACAAARRAATAEELGRYEQQLHVAREALGELAGALDPAVRKELDGDCLELERWLADERGRL